MKLSQTKFKITDIAGIGTIAIVFVISLYWIAQSQVNNKESLLLLYLLFAIYLTCFILVTREKRLMSLSKIYLFLGIQLLSAIFLILLFPIDFLSILTIIWAAILPYYFSLRTSIITMLLVILAWFSLFQYLWDRQMIFSGLLYGTFHFFTLMMSHHARQAERATEKVLQLNKELLTTQQLLAEASRQNERTRIARDLHDLLGHHLTALIINLQVAGYLSIGEAKDKIEQCHSLAKLLLGDVREAVTTLRENSNLDFESMVKLMVDNLPGLKVNLHIDAQLELEDLELAKTLLSCIQEASTNCLRHSAASQFWIILRQENKTLYLELYDNGQIEDGFVEGNGLTGMRERINALHGNLTLNTQQKHMQIIIKIPTYDKYSEVSNVD